MEKYKVIIDTDIGDDIDDAFALLLAMKSPELEILGVTTVYKDTVKRAKIAKALLISGGFASIPVYSGEKMPINSPTLFGREVDFDQPPLSFEKQFDNIQIDGTDGVDFIIRTLEQSLQPITIITLGALTNIARVLQKRPDLKNKIARLSVMGGAYLVNLCEYNFTCDPDAANEVLQSGIAADCVGVDITFKCYPSKEQLKKLENHSSECIKILLKMKKNWTHQVFFHDPLAVMCVFDKQFVTFEKRLCEVETKGKVTRGYVANLSDFNWQQSAEKSRQFIGINVKGEDFVEKCMERLLSY